VNFKNTIVIMTSNLGSHLIQDKLQHLDESNRDEIMDELRVRLLEMLKQAIRPEFLNRIDEIILFKPLTMPEIQQIVELQLKNVQKLISAKNITLEFSDDLKEWLARAGFDPAFGARPLKRTVQRYVVNRLSEKILAGEIAEGDTVKVDVGDHGAVEFVIKARAEVAE
jgi:ATP-dependent Clp protease ATP-binding subunit ClpB